MEQENSIPHFTAEEIRVLGALMEKSKTTPEYYPLTLNSLTAACNQKSSRFPVVDYSEEVVSAALRTLKGTGFVALDIGSNSRVQKFKHNMHLRYPFTEGELAIICLLFLRGPQTPGEINTNSNRHHQFISFGSVQETLNKLAEHNPPFVKELPKRSGQKELRYAHLFTI